ncbi:MAG TPA: outer membrane beta-barrel protein [Chitinophagaceae bacterium]
MRKLFILTVVANILLISTAFSQIEKGNWLVGGTFGYGNNSSSGGNNSNANITPNIGYAIGHNSVISTNLGFSSNVSESEVNNDYKTSTKGLSIGISWKKFHSFKENFGWYTDLTGGLSWSKNNYTTPSSESESTNNGYFAGINPGIYFLPTTTLMLNANVGGLNYYYSKTKNAGQPSSHNSSINVNLLNYFSFGINFILGNKSDK